MKKVLLFVISIVYFSCGKEKVVLLPEITHSEITEINDVSAAYLFYNETKPDSVELNRKNLISTTNWLVNVDKRLTLKQVIPHIKFLQEKKRNSSHKNENAKNYFTCNDTSRQSLGFVEFTDVNYKTNFLYEKETDTSLVKICINFKSLESISVIKSVGFCGNRSGYNWEDFSTKYNKLGFDKSIKPIDIVFNKNLLFKDYITFKAQLEKMKNEGIPISNYEYIFN